MTWDSINPDFGVRHRVQGLTPGFKRPEIWAQYSEIVFFHSNEYLDRNVTFSSMFRT
jgi:hypothetical protein